MCLDCGALSDESRCPTHRRARDQARGRGSAAARGYDGRYRRLRKEAIRLHIERYGRVCPGYRVPPHTCERFSVDHIIPLSDGGLNEPSNFQVLCLTCNQRKGRGTDRAVEKNPPVSSTPPAKRTKGYLIA
jgi:5-methylcytosine-specific restriction endonuclease McrA